MKAVALSFLLLLYPHSLGESLPVVGTQVSDGWMDM